MSNDHFVRFENVDKSYDGKQLVVKGLNLDIEEGEFVTCLLYTSPSPRDYAASRMPSSA